MFVYFLISLVHIAVVLSWTTSTCKYTIGKKVNFQIHGIAVLYAKKRNWLKRNGEIIIDLGFGDEELIAEKSLQKMNSAEATQAMKSNQVEDRVNFIAEDSTHSISGMTLRQISRGYGFSLNYLGDFINAQGITTLLEVDKKIGDMMTGQDIYELLVALQSQDPSEVNDGYMGVTVSQFAQKHSLSFEEFTDLCKEHGITFPFGPITVLHNSIYEYLAPFIEGFIDDTDENIPSSAVENILQ